MMKVIQSCLLLICLLWMSCTTSEKTKSEWEQLPDYPISGGVSAPFIGNVGSKIMVAGGCNFPEKSAAEGGEKQYYDEIFLLDINDNNSSWERVGKLPFPVAYGASVSLGTGIVCIGGNNRDSSLTSVFLLAWDDLKKETSITPMPSLPHSRDNFSVATIDSCIFVAGGNEDGIPSASFLRLDLKKPGEDWAELPCFPGSPRLQPVLVAQQHTEDHCLYLAGGFSPGTLKNAPCLPDDVLRFSVSSGNWAQETFLPLLEDGSSRTLTGGSGIVFGDSCILWAGGVNRNRFSAALDRPRQLRMVKEEGKSGRLDSLQKEITEYLIHPVEWYRFNSELLQYNIHTKIWDSLGEYEQLARAGAGMVISGNKLIVVCGELKPGIRTIQVNALQLR